MYRKGHVLLPLDRQEPYRARHLVWPGASNQSGTAAGTHFAWPRSRGAYRCTGVLPWRPLAYTPRIDRRHGAGGGISCAEGDSGPPRDGREPSWARPCEASGALFLSNGGSGGGHETCTLWPPPAPFGYFPVWESTSSARRRAKPPTRNRFLVEGRKRAYLSFPVSQRLSPLRRRPGGFPVAPWTPSGPIPICMDETSHKKQIPCGRQETGLPFFSRITKGFASAEATRGLSDRPLDPFGAHPYIHGRNLPQETDSLWKAGNGFTFLFTVSQRISPLRRRPGGFPIAPWTPSGPIPV